jgi:hypothetical protein
MFMDFTPDGIRVIKHRATSIQHQPSKKNQSGLIDICYLS